MPHLEEFRQTTFGKVVYEAMACKVKQNMGTNIRGQGSQNVLKSAIFVESFGDFAI